MKHLFRKIIRCITPDDGRRICPTCEGEGYIDTSTEEFDLDVPMMMVKCLTCDGTGTFYIPTHQEMG